MHLVQFGEEVLHIGMGGINTPKPREWGGVQRDTGRRQGIAYRSA